MKTISKTDGTQPGREKAAGPHSISGADQDNGCPRERGPKLLIACETVMQELKPLLKDTTEYLTLESGLHLQPKKLTQALQDLIDKNTDRFATIILGYGLCSMAVVGLSAKNSTLITPAVDDCICLFFGSRQSYLKQLKKVPGTYFLSKGWIDAGVTLVDDFKEMEARYGQKNAARIKAVMLKHYTRLAFIKMGTNDQKSYTQFARQAAAELNLSYAEIEGSPALIQKMVTGPWDREFIMTPPAKKITHADFGLSP